MKKMLSLAAVFAVLSYASPASAELKLGGDATIRVRGQFNDTEVNGVHTDDEDDLMVQYRIRLKASADLGSGYLFKALIQNEAVPAGYNTVSSGNSERYELDVSNFYFGRMMEDSHYLMGRLPLNSFNNPIFDIALYPIPVGNYTAVDIPVATYNFDRVFGFNYGRKIGPGELNGTLVVFDNFNGDDADNYDGLEGNGLLNDGYALHLSYKTNFGDITFEPQAIVALTDMSGLAYQNVAPITFGANLGFPVGKGKIGMSGFYTTCEDSKGATGLRVDSAGVASFTPASVDYSGYLLRLKGEYGPAMAWIDYNRTKDKSNDGSTQYDNLFVWAQYNLKVYESSTGTFRITPTLRYRASGSDNGVSESDFSQLRTELYATVTF